MIIAERSSFHHRPGHRNRFAANKHSSTDPDVTAVTVMSTTLRAAVESTIGKRRAPGAACLARPPFEVDCFCAAMMNLLEDQAAMQPDLDLDASSRVDPDREAQHRRLSGSNP
jgi:hypothetical protein